MRGSTFIYFFKGYVVNSCLTLSLNTAYSEAVSHSATCITV